LRVKQSEKGKKMMARRVAKTVSSHPKHPMSPSPSGICSPVGEFHDQGDNVKKEYY
jgi:hypothetical protein